MKRDAEVKCFVMVGVIATILAGCSGSPKDRRYYLLDARREGPVATSRKDVTVSVREFSVSPRFRPNEFVYRTGKFKYTSDYYNAFLSSAGPMIGEQTRQWLSQAGLFANAVGPGSDVGPTHVLEGNITSLYGNFLDQSAPRAVMGIEFFLLEAGRESKVVFHKAYDVETPVTTSSVDDLVEAYNVCLMKILTEFETDLHKALPETTQPTTRDLVH